MQVITDISQLKKIQQQALLADERRLCLLRGSVEFTQLITAAIGQSFAEFGCGEKLYHFCAESKHSESHKFNYQIITEKNYRQQLGQECQVLIFDGGDDFNPDAFAALVGTVVAGGIIFVIAVQELAPQASTETSTECSGTNKTSFNHYLFKYLAQDETTLLISQDSFLTEVQRANFTLPICDWLNSYSRDNQQSNKHKETSGYSVTQEQAQAVALVEKVNKGHRDRPLVLTADRGRGKSTALAIACANLLGEREVQLNTKKILICAPHKASLNVFYQHLEQLLPMAEYAGNSISVNGNSLCFIPIDELISEPHESHLLLVDEAAGIPVPQLLKLLNSYRRIVFSSTVHGYEGAGRGFTLKFLKALAAQKPQFRHCHINEPIRWSQSDPVERLLNQVLLLNAQLPAADDGKQPLLNTVTAEDKAPVYQSFVTTGAELGLHPELLANVFSLLVIAHYQTKPSDLKLLLEEPSISLVVSYVTTKAAVSPSLTTLRDDNEAVVIATALVIREGEISDELASQIALGRRRLKGHLLPQTLATQAGVTQMLSDKFLRVMRIAVHPLWQGQGAGSNLLKAVTALAKTLDMSWLGTSFGASEELLNFWSNNGFQFCRLGVTKDAASGEYAATLLTPLTEQSNSTLGQLIENYQRDFTYLLSDHFKQLPAELGLKVYSLLTMKNHSEQLLGDKRAVEAFVAGNRQLTHCKPALARYFQGLIQTLNIHQQRNSKYTPRWLLAFQYLIQQKESTDVISSHKLTGKKQLDNELKAFFSECLARLESVKGDV